MAPLPVSPSQPRLRDWLDRMSAQHVVVWGDLVADRFLVGSTTRVSREAPALVLRYESEEYRPGGAGNAALNAAALGARVTVAGYLADDTPGDRLHELLARAGVDVSSVVRRSDGATPKKTRVMAGGVHTVRQQILRIDHDRPWPAAEDPLASPLARAVARADALLISDYGLGTVTPARYQALRPLLAERGIPAVLDSRFALLRYPGVTAATPNESEVEEALHVGLNGEREAIEGAGHELLARLQARGIVITRGSCGMAVFRPDDPAVHLSIHGTDQIADVTGAGDTVIATLTLALAAGADLVAGARIANIAAGLVVLKHGTATVPRAELEAALPDS